MIIPVRCFTCGKPVSQFYSKFMEKVAAKEEPNKVLDSFGLTRYCCRSLFVGHVDLLHTVGGFQK